MIFYNAFMTIKAVIFDLDGTLVDSLADLANSVNGVLESMGLPAHTIDSYRRRVGDGARQMVSRALPEDRQDLLEDTLAAHTAYYRDHSLVHTRPYPGIADLIAALRERGLPLAVLSNKPDVMIAKVVTALFSEDDFTIIRGHREGVPLKPDPTSALDLATELGCRPQQIVFLGDTKVDLQTATNARMVPVGATWGFRDRAELENYGARYIIDHPAQFLNLLDEPVGSLA